ncbi:MAG: tRNA uridine-5-carboxymethylaminomethyl(34) synthesis GTPase MnmE [Sphingobacteriia bacterium]|nr:tRNA uridine-5-carboxymethylaminomethyl(34) synthesis GTPase MnmE [Sphingobacteriia bacterium]
MSEYNSTIYALATTYSKSGVAILRISGSHALKTLSLFNISKTLKPRYVNYLKLQHPKEMYIIDNAVVIYFEGPNSFTGEDVIELQVHGSKAVINTIINILNEQNFLRLAEPGEFAKRAFLNGKMDLTQAEGLADLIDAETEMQLKQAVKQVNGALAVKYEEWRKTILQILALTEAFIDFPEEDIPEDIINDAENLCTNLKAEINNHLSDNNIGEKIRDGIKVAIVGEPNVGKSSLINALAKREIAIVSDIPGTTRDAIEVHLNIQGYQFILTDTAGIRESSDIIEQIGIDITKRKYEEADLVIEIYDCNNYQKPISISDDKPKVKVINKIDLDSSFKQNDFLTISAKNNINIDQIIKELEKFASQFEITEESAIISRARYREHLTNALNFLEYFTLHKPIELAGEDLRLAASEIGKITGRISVDEILDIIFSSFCIGK